MSVWKDIRQKSLGREVRIEDLIKETSPHISHIIYKYIDAEHMLPKTDEVGTICIVHGSNKMMIFNGVNWELITEMSEMSEMVEPIMTSFRSSFQDVGRKTIHIKTENNNYEVDIR